MVKRRFLSLQISKEVKIDVQEGVSQPDVDSEGTRSRVEALSAAYLTNGAQYSKYYQC